MVTDPVLVLDDVSAESVITNQQLLDAIKKLVVMNVDLETFQNVKFDYGIEGLAGDVVSTTGESGLYGCQQLLVTGAGEEELTIKYHVSVGTGITLFDETVSFTIRTVPNEYTVTFDGNGSTSGSMDPQLVDKTDGGTLNANAFTRDGFAFKEWNTVKDGSGTSYADGATITPKEDITLYAQWEELKQYTITFVNEDGTELQSGKVTQGDTPVYEGSEPTKAATSTSTFTFAGWDKEIVPATEDATYTATFDEEPITATLTFDLAGGKLDGKTGKVTVEANVGEEITILDAPTRSGYTFVYWKGSKYQPGDSYTVKGDHTFTAVWKKVKPEKQEPAKPGTKKPEPRKVAPAKAALPATGDPSSITAAVAMAVAGAGLLIEGLRLRRR